MIYEAKLEQGVSVDVCELRIVVYFLPKVWHWGEKRTFMALVHPSA